MEQQNNPLFSLLGFLITLTILASLAAITLALLDFWIAFAVVATATAALWILLIVMITAHVVRRQTVSTMQAGADIALRATSNNDKWDTQKTKALSDLMREGMRLGQASLPAGNNGFPALLPQFSQDAIDGAFTIAGLENESVEWEESGNVD